MSLDEITLYREQQKRKHQEHMAKIKLQEKIIAMLKDKSKTPPNIIQNFARKYVLQETINILTDVPGLFKKRIPIYEINFFEQEIQNVMNQIEIDSQKENFNKIIKDLTKDVKDEDVKKAIIESLNISDTLLVHNNIKEIIYWIQVDLRVYGPYPEMPLYIENVDTMIYFTKEQQNLLKHIWDKIDPSTNNGHNGLRYKQMLDCSKSLVELYNIT